VYFLNVNELWANPRPHQSLDFLTPMEYLERQIVKVGDFFLDVID
jgi:hypothetical protein